MEPADPESGGEERPDPINRLPIFLRAYVQRKSDAAPLAASDANAQPTATKRTRRTPRPSPATLIFDTETTTDAAQRLRIGAFQLRKGSRPPRVGLFYDPDALTPAELELLIAEAATHGARLLTVRQFVDLIVFREIYEVGGTIVGFNLPFDISRLAIQHNPARRGRANPNRPGRRGDTRFQGGFAFTITTDKKRPPVRVKHLSQKSAFIEFGEPPGQRTPDGQLKRGLPVANRKGFFVDVKTLAAALTSESHSLASLSAALKVETPKAASDEHGAALTPAYIEYALRDVQATYECYAHLASRYDGFGLTSTRVEKIYSEASLGKAYLKQMGVRPWMEAQPDFDPAVIGQIMTSYFGGRAEVNIRRKVTQVLHCDFLSMYPTVCTLMGLWRYVIAEGVHMRDATDQTRAWLEALEPATLQAKDAWRQLRVLVQVEPDDDIFPVRARYGRSPSLNIGVNRLTSKTPLWFTLADCAASKLLRGKAPKIVRAIAFEAGQVQVDLSAINISGKADYRVDPIKDDFYCRVIDLRRDVRKRAKSEAGPAASELDTDQQALKILANATSYGIFLEFNPASLTEPETMIRYGADGAPTQIRLPVFEEPGAFLHPLVGALITGAARLMLALAERLAIDLGLSWVFCDTDSLAIAKPDAMDAATFYARAVEVRDWFGALNPYAGGGALLKIEDVNYEPSREDDLSALRPLYCFAVSSKRYVEFNLGPDGAPIIRKASAHGLGHLLPPYPDPDKPARMKAIGAELWQEDFWKAIIQYALAGDGVRVELDFHPGMASPAASRYAATTPALLAWFKSYNEGRQPTGQVQPFNFLLAYHSRKLEQLAATDPEAAERWASQRRDPRPAAPYNSNPVAGAAHAFDRESGEAIPACWLESYARNLAQYHIHRELKFWGGEWMDTGPLRRRHVDAMAIQYIGKEADRWEEQQYVGAEEDDRALEYGLSAEHRAALVESIGAAKRKFGVRRIRAAGRVSDNTILDILKPGSAVSDRTLIRVSEAIDQLETMAADEAATLERLLCWVRMRKDIDGLPAIATRLGYDEANLRKVLAGERKASRGLVEKMHKEMAVDALPDADFIHA
jgi:hypothetical protein